MLLFFIYRGRVSLDHQGLVSQRQVKTRSGQNEQPLVQMNNLVLTYILSVGSQSLPCQIGDPGVNIQRSKLLDEDMEAPACVRKLGMDGLEGAESCSERWGLVSSLPRHSSPLPISPCFFR